MLRAVTPDGFRQEGSGLIVPSDLARTREVWTKADVKTLDRATRLLKERGLLFQFACPTCGTHSKMELTRDPDSGQKILRCGHKDRIFSGAI